MSKRSKHKKKTGGLKKFWPPKKEKLPVAAPPVGEGGGWAKVSGGAVTSAADESHPAPYAVIYQSELDFISRCILDYPDIETGGQLFGYWTARGVPVVLYAIGPGPRANHQTTFFNQDVEYLRTVGNSLLSRYGLLHIGEWHSHHRLGLAHPSGHDSSTMVNSIRRHHLRRFLLCIGNCDRTHSTVNAFTYHEDDPTVVHAQWQLKRIASPFRRVVDEEMRSVIRQPHTMLPSHGPMNIAVNDTPDYQRGYWLTEKRNNLVLKQIIDAISKSDSSWSNWNAVSVKPQIDDRGHVHLSVVRGSQQEHIYFPARFPEEAPEVAVNVRGVFGYGRKASAGIEWHYDGDIFRSFMNYYNQIY